MRLALAVLAPLAACSDPEAPVVNEGNLADRTVVEAGEERGLVGRGPAGRESREPGRSE